MNNVLHLDYLPGHPEMTLYQNREMFHITTDTALLGEFLNIKHKDKVLDVGTNNGALLLYASMSKPLFMTGIDINEKAVEIAKKNMDLHNITNSKILVADAKKYYEPDGYDVIICNPPFFNTKDDESKNRNQDLLKARHEDCFSMNDIFECIKRNLKDNGRFYVLHRADRLNDIFEAILKNGLRVSNFKPIYDQNKEDAVCFVIEGKRSKTIASKISSYLVVKR
ncbi:MAG: methyltransferase domain-containing protein [Bacilli bacterium]|nr:methyltransferase domain-containing protein [Bacilli bacterium]